MTPHTHLAAGVAVSVMAAILYNVGFVIEKRALGAMPPVHARRIVHLLTSVLTSPLWLLGFTSMLGGLALQILALSLISISVVQPIFVSGIVVLLVLSHVSLKEHLGRREWGAVSIVVVSLLAISLSLDPSSDHAGSRAAFGALVLAAVPTFVVALWLFLGADRVEDGRRVGLRSPLFGLAAGLMYGVAALATKAVAAEVERYGVVASVPHVLSSPYLYTLIVTSAIGLLLFQTALQRCPASVIVPVSNVVSSTYVVAIGTVIFAEHLPSAGWKQALRVVGFMGVLVSVLVLANPRGAGEPEMPLVEEPVTLPATAPEAGALSQPLD